MNIKAIYLAYQGEVNKKGIGAPVIFVRTGGCHLRCYKDSLGTLCDTPEALEKNSGVEMSIHQIVEKLSEITVSSGGVKYICFSGGDPLWRKREEIVEFLTEVTKLGYEVSVETSGTLSIAPYREIKDVSWVLDYKSRSAAVKQLFVIKDLPLLKPDDFIKFVIYDEEDFYEFLDIVDILHDTCVAQIAIGVYWGGEMSNGQLVKLLQRHNLFGKVVINAQLHKLLTHYDLSDVSNTKIPEEI